jgi:hypothetical protein
MPKFLANGSRLNANHSASLAGRSACLHADFSKSLLNATSRAIFKVSRRHAHRLRHLMRCPAAAAHLGREYPWSLCFCNIACSRATISGCSWYTLCRSPGSACKS